MSTEEERASFDKQVRRIVYDHAMSEGLPPKVERVASTLQATVPEVEASFSRLADAHILVLQKDSREILMANPFSAVPTPFLVRTRDQIYYGNCIWDAMGIPAMLNKDARIETSCGCCRTAMALTIERNELAEAAGLIHFAIPAARWWDDIVFN
jgi:hypothetical protein